MDKNKLIEAMYALDERDIDKDTMEWIVYELERLDKLKKPVIPQFIADWIEDLKSNGMNLLSNIRDFTHDDEINDYIYTNGNILMEAWLYGYEVEKEPLWVVQKNKSFLESMELKRTSYSYCDLRLQTQYSESYRMTFKSKEKAEAVALLVDGKIMEVE